jgi:hypothetical protein
VSACGGLEDTQPVKQEILAVRLEAPATSVLRLAVRVVTPKDSDWYSYFIYIPNL